MSLRGKIIRAAASDGTPILIPGEAVQRIVGAYSGITRVYVEVNVAFDVFCSIEEFLRCYSEENQIGADDYEDWYKMRDKIEQMDRDRRKA